jgi:hypothetical protein
MSGLLLRLATHAVTYPAAVRPLVHSIFEPDAGSEREPVVESHVVREATTPASPREAATRTPDPGPDPPPARPRGKPVLQPATPERRLREPRRPASTRDSDDRREQSSERVQLVAPVVARASSAAIAPVEVPVTPAPASEVHSAPARPVAGAGDREPPGRGDPEPPPTAEAEPLREQPPLADVAPSAQRAISDHDALESEPPPERRQERPDRAPLPAERAAAATIAARSTNSVSRAGNAPAPGAAAERNGGATPPDVHVTIGRIEVRAPSAPAVAPTAVRPPQKSSAMDLAAYLRDREEGRRP